MFTWSSQPLAREEGKGKWEGACVCGASLGTEAWECRGCKGRLCGDCGGGKEHCVGAAVEKLPLSTTATKTGIDE